MKARRSVVYLCLILLALPTLYCNALDQAGDALSPGASSTRAAQQTSTAVAQATTFWPTATALAGAADTRMAVLEDTQDEGVRCSGEPLTDPLPAHVDVQRATLALGQTTANVTLEYSPDLDLRQALMARGATYQGGILIHNPEFPLPPDNPEAAFDTMQNEMYFAVWDSDEQQFTTLQGLFRDGKWHNTTPAPAVDVAVAGNRLVFSLPADLFPAGGAWYAGSGTEAGECNYVGLTRSGEEWQPTPLEWPEP